MKILTLGGIFPVDGLRELGHEVLAFASEFASPHPANLPTDFFSEPESLKSKIKQAIQNFGPDWILQVDDSSPLVHYGLEEIQIPKAWYAIDTHIHKGWHPHYAGLFDLVFCAQKNHLEAMRQYQSHAIWLPTFFTGQPEFLDWKTRKHEVSFVGTLDANTNPRRIALLNSLQDLGCRINIQQAAYHPIYSQSRMVVNQSSSDDLNFRFFEAMGCGALLITDGISHSLSEMGEPGRDFLVYEPDNAVDLNQKIRWVQEHPSEAEAMAKSGHNLILRRHLASHRAESIISAFTKSGSPRASDKSQDLAQLTWVLAYLGRLNLPEFLVQFFTQEAHRYAQTLEKANPENPWACLILSRMEIDGGDEIKSLEYLNRIKTLPMDPVLRRSYFFLQALLLAGLGDFLKAKQKLVMGIKEFPHDQELNQLYDFLKSKDAS